MQKMKVDKEMKQGGVDFKYYDNILCCKWYNNKVVLLFASSIEGINMSSKPSINCPSLVQMHNKGMGGADLMNQKTAAY